MKKCIVENDDLIYAKENDELPILDYLKMIGDDIINFTSNDCVVKSCSVNFGDYSVNLELNILNKNLDKISKDFNSFCQNNEWCDKKTLSFDELNGAQNIMWDSTILINPDYDDVFLNAFTEFDIYNDKMYISVKLDG